MSTIAVQVEVNGQMIPASDATWYQVAPCGCTCGATVVQMHYSGEVRTDGEAAFAEGLSAAERAKDKANGFTYELGRRDEVVDRMNAKCPHTPKWGIEPRPQREGYTWAANYDSRVQHLAPTEHVITRETRVEPRPIPIVEAVALCGNKHYSWSNEWHRVDGKVECKRCIKAATS